jgi:PAS domain S-box-containing protein
MVDACAQGCQGSRSHACRSDTGNAAISVSRAELAISTVQNSVIILTGTLEHKMTSANLALTGSYDHGVVALSVLIAILGSYTALDLGERVTFARGGSRLAWLMSGCVAMGIGTWSMHYVGMLAFRLPLALQYDWPTSLLSLLPSILASAIALFVVSRPAMGALDAVGGSLFMGAGISGLHYTAMASMRMQAMCHYSPALVTLSVVLAIAISLLSLWLTFFFRVEASGRRFRKIASALLMGAAISVMHYTGMASASYTRSSEAPDLSHAVSISSLGIAGIGTVTVMVLEIALLTSLVDRLQKHRALLDELFEQAPHAVALMNVDNQIVRVNRGFTQIFGYTPQEILGRGLTGLIVPEELRHEARRNLDLLGQGQRVDVEVVRQRKDGSRLHVSLAGVPVSVPGRQIAAYAIFGDITGRKRSEEELQGSFRQLRELTARLQSVREEERTKVAREIHDELGQALTAIKIDLASLIGALRADQEAEVEKGKAILKLVDETILSVRRIATELRPGILDDLGLVAAVEWAAEEFEARTGIQCHLDLPEGDIVLDQERTTAIFRIFQETLTNVTRHAEATRVDVRLGREDGNIVLEVRDNGRGIAAEELSSGRSLGILGMRERALLLGGELTIRGAPGKGTTVKVLIPDCASVA